jgi:hypothetical protein
MTLILCSSCNRHIFHPESGGDDACPFCATPVLVARADSTTAVATGSRVGATVVAALVTLSAVQGCASESVSVPEYGVPFDDDAFETYDATDGQATDAATVQDGSGDGGDDGSGEAVEDAIADGSSDGSGDSDE